MTFRKQISIPANADAFADLPPCEMRNQGLVGSVTIPLAKVNNMKRLYLIAVTIAMASAVAFQVNRRTHLSVHHYTAGASERGRHRQEWKAGKRISPKTTLSCSKMAVQAGVSRLSSQSGPSRWSGRFSRLANSPISSRRPTRRDPGYTLISTRLAQQQRFRCTQDFMARGGAEIAEAGGRAGSECLWCVLDRE